LAILVEPAAGDIAAGIRELLRERGALFFDDIAKAIGGFRHDVLTALWNLVWAGEVTNDTLAPVRSLRRVRGKDTLASWSHRQAFRSRRSARTPASEGRWSLLFAPDVELPTATERQTAWAAQLIERYGVLTREMVAGEGVPGGFAGLYPVLKAMEEAGRVRRGYFVAGLGAAQFAALGAEDRLRELSGASRPARQTNRETEEVLVLAATDPANPYGAGLPWPERTGEGARPQRAAGARVVLVGGQLVGYVGRTGQHLLSFTDSQPDPTSARRALVAGLVSLARSGHPVYLTRIDGGPPADAPLSPLLIEAGFVPTTRGYLLRARDAPIESAGA
jgi:ATP-dependent Lhr-like helicase